MSFSDCVNDAVNGGDADKDLGREAKDLWGKLADRYESGGHPRDKAEAFAEQDVKSILAKNTNEKRHIALAQISVSRKNQVRVVSSGRLETIATDLLEHAPNSPNRAASVIGQQRALVRMFNYRLNEVIKQHGRGILGANKNPAGMKNLVRELHGESTGDTVAYALSDAVRKAFDDMRIMFNEAGGTMSKLESWGIPHSHNRKALREAGFEQWSNDVRDAIEWAKMESFTTGKPMTEEGRAPVRADQDRVLRGMWDNIVFGKETEGFSGAASLNTRRSRERIIPFITADSWINYNTKYGSDAPFGSIMGHASRMARDITLIREFGPNTIAGFEDLVTKATKKAKELGDGNLAHKIEGNSEHARRMLNINNGSLLPKGPSGEMFATFMSSTRHILSAAFLDRAVISAVSDTNTMRMAAQAIGMNPKNVISRHVKLMANKLSREEALRGGWIADTLADPGAALSRFQSEVPASEIAERISNASMRIQGLAGWTDYARIGFQMEMSGLFAANGGRKLKDVDEPLRSLLIDKGITGNDWAAFTRKEHLFKAGNGATFASPIYWREATDLPSDKADEISLKMQALVEEQTEFAVPTRSLWMNAFVEGKMPPGSIGYEMAKSGLLFKSFPMTFTNNQIRRVASIPTLSGKISYGFNLAAGATVTGAFALQLFEISKGNDPLQMDDPKFWGAAALRGGAFGIIGDVVSTGQSNWNGGFPTYLAGPMGQLLGDTWTLGIQNGFELATGQETNFAKELTTIGKRYTPLGQTPVVGPAIDRIFWDQLHGFLDEDSLAAMMKKAGHRPRSDQWWLPGQVLPSRTPDLLKAVE